jgi:hypothetical protein
VIEAVRFYFLTLEGENKGVDILSQNMRKELPLSYIFVEHENIKDEMLGSVFLVSFHFVC